jgi:hypothetical protein
LATVVGIFQQVHFAPVRGIAVHISKVVLADKGTLRVGTCGGRIGENGAVHSAPATIERIIAEIGLAAIARQSVAIGMIDQAQVGRVVVAHHSSQSTDSIQHKSPSLGSVAITGKHLR